MGRRKDKPTLTWLYDRKEQRPYDLAVPDEKLFMDGGALDVTLEAGDISCWLDGEPVSVVIERKAHGDMVGCARHDQGCRCSQLGNDPNCGARCRFERELARLAAYRTAHVIIEAPFSLIRAGYSRSQMSGLAVANSFACWAVRFGVHFWPVTNRTEGQVWARTLLQEAAKHHYTNQGHQL